MSILEKGIQVFKESEGRIRPHCIVSGPTGSGKTFNINLLANRYSLPLIKINAAQITKEGYSGASLSKLLVPLKRLGNKPNIIHVEEFDKLYISDNSGSPPSEITIGVQNEFLDLLENKTANVIGDYGHYNLVNISNSLFIFSGAFNGTEINSAEDLIGFNVKREFIGRIAIFSSLKPMDINKMLKLVDSSELLEEYLKIIPKKKSKTIQAIKARIKELYKDNFLGARLVNNLVHEHFLNN